MELAQGRVQWRTLVLAVEPSGSATREVVN
jgi:hypothetical protein